VPTIRTAAILGFAVVAALLGGGSAPAGSSSADLRVLVFTKTAGFRHDSIPVAVQALRALGARNGIQIDATEDSAAFSDAGLRRYDVVVFLLTTGDVLDARQHAALQRYIRSGGGFAGVHSASDTEHDWPWYGGLVGAYFRSHPAIQRATVTVAEPRDVSTRGLPRRWTRTDEWYGFATNPRGDVHVLATLDETSYAPGDSAMGADHPIAWSHLYDGGRAWYTAGGHTQESYSEPRFRAHLLGGILWAAGPPRIVALSGTVRQRRLVVTCRLAKCRRCHAELRVRVRGRSLVTPLAVEGSAVRGRSSVLPAGRWHYAVIVRDAATGFGASAFRLAQVP
jgi:type 1 glutamine amidotransferase